MTDAQLLREFVERRSQQAFADLVRRHVDVVYSAARRQTRGDATLAEEVTQQVFIKLAQKAATLSGDVLIGGWLYNTVRFVARDVVRKEQRRSEYEHKAAEMAMHAKSAAVASEGKSGPWQEAEIVLDEAMEELNEQTRGLIVLRFFQGKTAREVGELLGISEEAARKRVSRAVDELRERFVRRGVVMSADALAAGLATAAMITAPAGLAGSAASAAMSSSSSAAAATTTSSAAALKTGATIMAAIKVKTAVAAAVGAILLVGGGVKAVQYFSTSNKPRTVRVEPQGPLLKGVVLAPDGKPIANAEILIGSVGKTAYSLGPPPRGADATATNTAGQFAVHKPDPPFAVIVRCDAGYAQVSWKQLESGTEIRLQPWGRIEGDVIINGRPQAKATVELWRVGGGQEDPFDRLVHHETQVKTDAKGHYVVEKVPPGEMWLFRIPEGKMRRSADWQYVQVGPGKTAKVSMGGVAGTHTVVGRVDVPAELTSIIDFKEQGRYSYEANVRIEMPQQHAKHAADETPEQYAAVEQAFGKTDVGRLAKQWMFGWDFSVNPDGTFRIENLPPGKFTLSIRHFEEDPEVNFMEDIAREEAKFEVPATQPSSTPIDLGTLSPQGVNRIRPGAPAADFTVKTLDGKTWSYADHKGKPIVLIFWGAYQNTQPLTEFAEFAKKWGGDDRVGILGAFVSNSLDDAKNVIKQYSLTFPQTPEGEKLMPLYDSSWPEAVVISKDGMIMQKHLHGKVLEKYVKKAVGGDAKTDAKPDAKIK